MMTYKDMVETDIVHPNTLYRYYKCYKYLYDFWVENKDKRMVSEQDMRNRIDYILRNQIKQRDEIATLCWILGEEDARKINY